MPAKISLEQIKIMTGLELCNLFGINVLRFSKDTRAKKRAVMLSVLWAFLIMMMLFYVGGLSYGLVRLGAEDEVISCLIAVSSILIFIFGILKAGSHMFRIQGFDMISALPVTKGVIVISRFLRMYTENMLLAGLVLIPGIAVYAWSVRPGATFYLNAFLGIWSVPLLPMTGAILAGALVSGISARMRHKSLAASALTLLLAFAVMFGSSRLTAMEGMESMEIIAELSGMVSAVLEDCYPPAVWLGTAIVKGEFGRCLMYTGMFLAVFAAAAAIVSACFQSICRNLHTTAAKHDYQVGELKADSSLVSLCRKEFRRYFASSIYVSNTLIGPILGCVISGALLFTGPERIKEILPVPVDLAGTAPFLLTGTFCMMTTAATSVSMEGKNWWLVKSLPLPTKTILDAKILMNLILVLPFYLLSEVFLILALRPGIQEGFWLAVIPAVILLFACIYGITINLHFPVMDWENEVSVVKQSASAILGGMGGAVLAVLGGAGACVVPGGYLEGYEAVLCALILGVAWLLYRKNNRIDLRGI